MIKIGKTHTESRDNRNFMYFQVSLGQSKFAAKIIVCCQLSNLLQSRNEVNVVFLSSGNILNK